MKSAGSSQSAGIAERHRAVTFESPLALNIHNWTHELMMPMCPAGVDINARMNASTNCNYPVGVIATVSWSNFFFYHETSKILDEQPSNVIF